MNSMAIIFAFPSIFSFLVSIFLIWLIGFKKKRQFTSSIAILAFPILFWSLFYALEILSMDNDLKFAFEKLTFLGKTTILPAFLIFAWRLNRKELKDHRILSLLMVEPVVVFAFLITNDVHGLFIENTSIVTNFGVDFIIIERGPIFILHLLYTYVLGILGLVLLFKGIIIESSSTKFSKITLMAAFVLPFISDLLFITGVIPIKGFSITPFFFGVAIVIGIRDAMTSRILDNVPLALDNVFQSMTDGVILLDEERRIFDMNRSAEKMTHIDLKDSRGKMFEEVRPDMKGLIFDLKNEDRDDHTISIPKGDVTYHFNIKRKTLKSEEGEAFGLMVVVRDITKEKQSEIQLANTNIELEKRVEKRTAALQTTASRLRDEVKVRQNAQETAVSERKRSEFYLDLLSHDIANIHQGISTSMQLLDMVPDEEKKKRYQKMIADLVNKAIKLTSNVKTLSNLKKTKPKLKMIDLGRMIRASIMSVKESFPDRVIRIDLIDKDQAVVVPGEDIMGEIFYNLLHNSVKYQNTKMPEVKVIVKPFIEKGSVSIDIEDNGPGIPDEMKRIIFNRIEMSEKMRHSGIGLSLVKELVDRYNGTIVIEDRIKGDPSKGTRVRIMLPVVRNQKIIDRVDHVN